VRKLTVLVVLLWALAARPAVAEDVVVLADEAVGDTGRLRELTVTVPGVDRPIGVRVLLPAGHDRDRTWPLLLLLHGAGDDHTTWTENTDVEDLTADLPFVVVMPEGGRTPDTGWYSDWAEPGGPQWESAHLRQLLPFLEDRYSAGGARERRVVAGLSMGGFGAMSYAARHPDLFVGAASFSGAVHTTIAGPASATVFEQANPYVGTPGDGVWGPYETSEVTWQGHNPTDLATNLRPVALWVRTGNGVPLPGDDVKAAPVEAGVYTMNVAFHDRLQQAGIAHTWVDRGHGVHAWSYWEDDLAATLPAFAELVAAPPGPPATFDYRFVEETASVFGWRFEVTGRAGPAFTELTGVDAAGMTAAGSGTLVATAPDGRSVTAALSATPKRLDLPVGSTPAAPAATPTTLAAAPAGRDTLPATGGAVPVALAAVLVAMAILGRVQRRRSG
jgi:S-formylglutathione hydrolase FrmB